jgi:hypothetical protein
MRRLLLVGLFLTVACTDEGPEHYDTAILVHDGQRWQVTLSDDGRIAIRTCSLPFHFPNLDTAREAIAWCRTIHRNESAR